MYSRIAFLAYLIAMFTAQELPRNWTKSVIRFRLFKFEQNLSQTFAVSIKF